MNVGFFFINADQSKWETGILSKKFYEENPHYMGLKDNKNKI